MNIPYYTRDVYSLNNYLVFENTKKIRVYMTARTIRVKMMSNYPALFDQNKIENAENWHFKFYINLAKDLKKDGFRLKITPDKNIIIDATNERSIRYAIGVLNNLIEKRGKDIYVPIIEIEDEPSFKLRGVIEGFYGEPWSHENRLDVISFMDKHRMNAFMYAPKDDEYHRNKWRELYLEDKLNELLVYKQEAQKRAIDFYYCISPGNDFNYASDDEFEILYRKLDQVIDKGVRNFALLMDDIDYNLSEENANKFIRPGIAHAYITNKINNYITNKIIDAHVIMCPTEYHSNWDSFYLTDLSERMDEDVMIFFTGDNVCAEVITNEVARNMREVFNRPVALWENYPVNDFWKARIFLGPLINRGTKIGNYFDALVSNPMNQWEASKIGVLSVANYMWNSEKYDPEKSFNLGIKEVIDDKYFSEFKVFAQANLLSPLTDDNLQDHKTLVANEDIGKIDAYYKKLEKAAKTLIKVDAPVIKEIKPWLERALGEVKYYKQIINNEYNKEELLEFLAKPYLLGDELFSALLDKYNVLTHEEYLEYVRKHTGNRWWRVWEEV